MVEQVAARCSCGILTSHLKHCTVGHFGDEPDGGHLNMCYGVTQRRPRAGDRNGEAGSRPVWSQSQGLYRVGHPVSWLGQLG